MPRHEKDDMDKYISIDSMQSLLNDIQCFSMLKSPPTGDKPLCTSIGFGIIVVIRESLELFFRVVLQ